MTNNRLQKQERETILYFVVNFVVVLFVVSSTNIEKKVEEYGRQFFEI